MGLTFDKSRVQNDINEIIAPDKSKVYHPYFMYTLKLHTVDKDLGPEDNIVLHSIKIERNYLDNIHDYIEIEALIPQGVFFTDIYDYLNNMEATLICAKQLSDSEDSPVMVSERYRLIYPLDKNREYPNLVSQLPGDLNNLPPIRVVFQLVDRAAEALRIKTVSGSFDPKITKNKDMSIKSVLKSIISSQANKILIENKPCLEAVYIEEPDNTEQLKAFTLNSGTRVVEVSDHIQESNLGLYLGGVGNYIQRFGSDYKTFKKSYFVYSVYNSSKYDKEPYKVLFYLPPMQTIPHLSLNTYKYEANVLKVIGKTSNRIEDNKDSLLLSNGTGFRSTQSRSMMKKPVKFKEDQTPIYDGQNFATQIVYDDRPDGINFALNKGMSSNHFKEVSDVFSRKGNVIIIEVSHLDPDFIQPGSKCKILYEDRRFNLYEIYGVIQKCYIVFSKEATNMTQQYSVPRSELYSRMTITIFCTNQAKCLDSG